MNQNKIRLIQYIWILLIPLAYLGPVSLARYSPHAMPVVFVAAAVAAASLILNSKTTLMDKLAASFSSVSPVLLVILILYCTISSYITAWHNYSSFSPHLPQLGIFSQSIWTTIHGHLFANTHETINGTLASHFGVHFSPTLFLLIPFYAIKPSPLMLMFLQSAAVAAAALPFYLLMKTWGARAGAFLMVSGLLGLPAVMWAGSNDFHDGTFLPVLLLTAVLGIEKKNFKIFLPAALLALGVREDSGLILFFMGFYAAIRGVKLKHAGLICALGLCWFYTCVKIIIPHYASPGIWIDPARFFSLHMGKWGQSPGVMLTNVLGHPVEFLKDMGTRNKLHYAYALFQPTLFLPVLAGAAWIMAVPSTAVNMISSQEWMRRLVGYYAVLPVVFAYLSASQAACKVASAAAEVKRNSAGLVMGIVLAAGVLPAYILIPGPRATRPSPPMQKAQALVELIPPGASVYVPISLFPHMANRTSVHCWESIGERGRAYEKRGEFDWVIIWEQSGSAGPGHDAPLAEILESDERFEKVPGSFPFLVFRNNNIPASGLKRELP